MRNVENFINLRQLQKNPATEAGNARFGKKQIILETVADSNSAAECAHLLSACVISGILKPDTQVGQNSINHQYRDQSGQSFVELTTGKGFTYNVAAELVSPDPRKFVRSADLSLLTSSDKITIISGTCLFSAPATVAKLNNGLQVDICDPGKLDAVRNRVVDIEVDDRLQAYEVDSVIRLTAVMSAINTQGKKVELTLNVPRVEYYLYVMKAFEEELISADLVLKWLGMVDERSARIESLIKKRIPAEFEYSSLAPLMGIESKVKASVKSGKRGLLPYLVNSLKSQSLFWKYLIEKDPPNSFGDISRLSYNVAYLIATQNGSFPIAIEDPEEAPILDNLKRKLDGLSIKMLALYPHSNAIPIFEPKNGKVNSYFLPAQENQLGVLREVVRLNKQK